MIFPLDAILNILDQECQGGIWRFPERSRNPRERKVFFQSSHFHPSFAPESVFLTGKRSVSPALWAGSFKSDVSIRANPMESLGFGMGAKD